MNQKADPSGFGQYVPGFDFLQKLAQGGNASMAGWVAPTLDPKALDQRISELKAVQFWLEQNAAALKATLQALEVQKMTLATLHSMNAMPGAASAKPGAGAAGAATDPMQYWSALTRQFQQIATDAMKDVAARSAAAPAAKAPATPAAAPAKKAAKKAAPRSRKTD